MYLCFLQGEGNSCSTVLKRRGQVNYCYQEKETVALPFSGEGIWCSTVLRRRKLVHYCSQGEGNWFSTVLKEKGTGALLLCFQEKETGALLFSGEGR